MKIPSHTIVNAWDEHGRACEIALVDEQPLTIYVNDQRLVTLMTLGVYPEALAIGYLRNQHLLQHIDDVIAIKKEDTTIRITTRKPLDELRAVCGCGIGSTFSSVNENLTPFTFDALDGQKYFSRNALSGLLTHIKKYETDDKKMAAAHACALGCRQGKEITYFVEDVSRHNAVDTIAGLMWEAGVAGENHVFYTTGRITSEITLKIAHMGIPVIVSRSMPSKSGCVIAEKMNMIIIGRARQQQYLLFGNPAGFQRKS